MADQTHNAPPARPIRVASVSYFNSKPLIEGLDREPSVALSLAVPAKLVEGLQRQEADVALLPVIDYQRLANLVIIPAGCIGCDGPTLTVRIFSRVPIDRIVTLACDVESHTSVALARVILAEQYQIRPTFMPLADTADEPQSLLLIGDKVVCEEPAGYPYQLDLGEAWKSLTGLPFVFAVWTARQGVELGSLPQLLEAAKKRGLAVVDRLVTEHAVPRGWPVGVARKYLTEYLNYDVGPRQIEAIRLFHSLAWKHGALSHEPRDLIIG